MPEFTEMLWVVIPIDARDIVARFADEIMNDATMFDDVRLSADGQEPATYLMTVVPSRKDQAEDWRKRLLPLTVAPEDYPTRQDPSVKDLADSAIVKLDGKFFIAITDRIDGTQVKAEKAVRLIDSRYVNTRAITSQESILGMLNLVEIKPIKPYAPARRGA